MVDGQRRGFIDVTPAWGQETRSSHNLRKFSYSPVGEDIEAFMDSNVEADAPMSPPLQIEQRLLQGDIVKAPHTRSQG
jgi:hypothetical protein